MTGSPSRGDRAAGRRSPPCPARPAELRPDAIVAQQRHPPAARRRRRPAGAPRRGRARRRRARCPARRGRRSYRRCPAAPQSAMWLPARLTIAKPASASAARFSGGAPGDGTSPPTSSAQSVCGTSRWPIGEVRRAQGRARSPTASGRGPVRRERGRRPALWSGDYRSSGYGVAVRAAPRKTS